MPSVLLHGELGSLDEILGGIGVFALLVIDGVFVALVFRTPVSNAAKIWWTVGIFATVTFAWIAYGIARKAGWMPPPLPAAARDGKLAR